ncbi:ATP phosphoribosyltransferase regulatory subunit [Salisediminibacterium selenitireducens]|uniref:ATP phosphoribosyltransferase regulatory subunit n=1 Tax=Bacillus selenitireducens (strain ATCC 700615 / DSM 15326 / MLS10) TaxID=439292 RepID=D6Y109_BACIE|nr:ATP phosphoribosyltransferase regulatory subunit [Salisediminibacterium selenitireducens]ADH98613.1 histidyl-tRNA synthetase 2 [[Bacillus] selenitireducens MLS10]
MSKLFMFEKPLGMRDTLPELFELKRKLRNAIGLEVTRWGYEQIATPTLEFYETVGQSSAILDQQLFKLLDQEGNTLVLRPDMTAPIARIAASTLRSGQRPLRLTYDAPVFRAQQREGGRPAEFEQIGCELIGDGSSSADAEIIALMAASMKEAGLSGYQVAIGHIGFVNALLSEVLGNEERTAVFRRYLYEKNYVGFRKAVNDLPLSGIDKQRLTGLLKLKGTSDVLSEADTLVSSPEGKAALKELRDLVGILEQYGLNNQITLDLNLVMHMSYYTGVVFEAYSQGLGSPVGSGGRYDSLLDQFEHPEPATGFGLRLDRLTEALGTKTPQVSQDLCIVYSANRRIEALDTAVKERGNGRRVVMQDVAGVKDVDAFTEGFQDVVYVIGSQGNGGAR